MRAPSSSVVCSLTLTFASLCAACGQQGVTGSGTSTSTGSGGSATTSTTGSGGASTTSTTGAGGGGGSTTSTTVTTGAGGSTTTSTTGSGGAGGGATTTGAGGMGTTSSSGTGGMGGMPIPCGSVADCPLPPNECVVANCIGGQCGTLDLPDSLLPSVQPEGDCKINKCSGFGTIITAPDDNDLPIDGKACTTDVCTDGVPSHAVLPAGSMCGAAMFCDAAGNCSGCAIAADCPGVDGPCQTRTCSGGMCGMNFVPVGTPAGMQMGGDCKKSQCNGMGALQIVEDNQDKPVDGALCTSDVCTAGVPTNPPIAAGTACNENGGTVCNAVGSCLATFTVVRLGDGAAALSAAAAPVFLEQYTLDGVLVPKAGNPLALPTTPSGSNRALTMTGSSTSEGNLSLSANGSFVTLAGYDAPVGTAAISSTTAATVNRIVGRVDASGNIDTSTRLDGAFSGGNVRGATSIDGQSFWVSGTASGSTGGVAHALLGALGSTQILAQPNNNRFCHLQLGQLYCSAGAIPFVNVFTVGVGAPILAGQTATTLAGMPVAAGPSPFSFAVFDRNAAVPGADTLYVGDDRSVASGGGVQKWTSADGVNWALSTTLNNGLTSGVRGLAAYVSGANVVILVTTGNGKIVVFTDDGSMNPMGTTLVSAAANTAYRGIAISPK